MADTCIVCLVDLSSDDVTAPAAKVQATSAAPPPSPRLLDASHDQPNESNADQNSSKPPNDADSILDNPNLIAHLLPCGHELHNECLKPWVERANSCPMCRQNFNVVELKTSLTEPPFSSYIVEDKRQVADLDPAMIVEDVADEEDDDDLFQALYVDPCLVCEHYGEEEHLLLCDGCSATTHTYCAGLDGVPAGPWFCQSCLGDLPHSPSSRSRTSRVSRTRGGQQRRLRRVDQSSDAWARVWQSVWDNLNIDLDFPFNEDQELSTRTLAQRREFNEWQQRFRIAESHGAGAAARFRDTAASLLDGRPASETPATPHPESQEEIRAWNAFDKACEIATNSNNSPQPRNKRKSAPTSPAEPSAEPERRLKRPRTRRPNQDGPGESSSTVSHTQDPAEQSTTGPASRSRSLVDVETGGPGFFQSLLNEVQTKVNISDDTPSLPRLNLTVNHPNTDQPSPSSSSPGTPTASNYPSPHTRPSSPPPIRSSRPASPPLTSRIEPIFAAAVQPHLPPLSSPSRSASDSEGDSSSGRASKSARSRHSKSASSTRKPTASLPHLDSASLEQIRSMKAEIQQMVSAALKPAYHKHEIDSEQFTDINRDISRMLYDKVGEAGGLNDESEKEKWQSLAALEVEAAVRRVKGGAAQALIA